MCRWAAAVQVVLAHLDHLSHLSARVHRVDHVYLDDLFRRQFRSYLYARSTAAQS